MRLNGWLHRQLAWLALCAMVFGAVAPSISKFLAATQGIRWVEICGTSGSKHVTVDSGSNKVSEAPIAGDSHCDYCLLQHHSPIVPTDPYTWKTGTVLTDRLLTCSGRTTIFKRFTRDAHLSRAPPAFS